MTDVTGTVPLPDAPPALDGGDRYSDIVDQWGDQSFPASDPPQNW